jgi:hypothetical protein
MTIVLCIATLSSLLNNFVYTWFLSFLPTSMAVAFDPSDPPLICSHYNCKQPQALFLLDSFCIKPHFSSLWYINIIVTLFLSCHPRTAMSPECLTTVLSFLQFLIHHYRKKMFPGGKFQHCVFFIFICLFILNELSQL